MKKSFGDRVKAVKRWLGGLSFRTGVVLIVACVVAYVISFAQMLLPLSVTMKSVLWVVFFGLAKTFQYAGLAVLGTAGVKRFRQWWRR